MTTSTSLSSTRSVTRTTRIGVILAMLLAIADIVGTLIYVNNPMPVVLGAFLLIVGGATLLGVYPAWSGRTWGIWTIAASRLLSTVPLLPLFFIEDAPAEAVPSSVAQAAVTLIAIVLVLLGVRRRHATDAS